MSSSFDIRNIICN